MTFWQDVRSGWRQLVSARGFAAAAIITFALGVGAATAIFSAVYAVVLQPFPFAEPDRVVSIGEKWRAGRTTAVSPGNFNDWRTQSSSYSELAARGFVSFNLSSGEVPERVLGTWVTHNYFTVFGIPALHGRTFSAEEDRPGTERVVVLSHRLWTRVFGTDPRAVGRTIKMDGHPYTVIGVMGPEFDRLGGTDELWVPAAFTSAQLASHDGHSFMVVGRLAHGISIEQAAAELPIIFDRVKSQFPAATQIREGIVIPYTSQILGNWRQRLLVLFGAVALVMFIACGNVAHLLLARARARAHEVALRASLGASRVRMVRQFLTETLVLALIGGGGGVVIAYIAVPALLAISPGDVPRLDQTTVNPTVLLFALGTTMLCAFVAGIVPAMRWTRLDLTRNLSDGGRTVAKSKDTLRVLLVSAEVALAIVLLAGAGLLVRSAIYLQSVDEGFDGTGVLTARISLPEAGYEEPARVEQAFMSLVDRLSRSPSVEVAAASSSAPMAPGANNNGLVPEGKVFDPNDFVLGRLGVVTGDYFRAFRIPVVAGRAFTIDDRREAPKVMMLSETAARRLFPGESAIGKRVGCCEAGPNGETGLKLIIGIVGDVRTDGPQEEARADFYVPIQQAPPDAWRWLQRTITVVVRGTTGDPAALAGLLRDAVGEMDRTVPVHSIATMDERLRTSLAEDRFNTTLMLLLGAIGLFLSAIGLYGVIASVVSQRRHEIAIRIALGAQSHQVVRMVMRQGMQPVWFGVGVGLIGAVAASRALSEYVHGVTTRDPLTLVAVVALLVAVAFVANLLPAWGASRVNTATLLIN